MKRVIVHIDRLVLNGFERQDRDAIAESLRAELGQLLSKAEAAQALTAMNGAPRLSADIVKVDQGTKSAQIGKLIASGIARGGRR